MFFYEVSRFVFTRCERETNCNAPERKEDRICFDLRAVRSEQCCSFSRLANGRRWCLNYSQIRSNQLAGGCRYWIVLRFPTNRHIVGEEHGHIPFTRRSSTNRRIRSVVYRRRHGRRHGNGPWAYILNEKFDFRTRQSSIARGLFIARCL